MKIVTLTDVKESGRDVHCPKGGFVSYRYLLAADNMGFSVHKTVIPRGAAQHWHYKNHLEACFCIQGAGIITNLETGEKHWIFPDTLYALNNHDDHTFEAVEDTILISVFNPPVKGGEVHREDGSYE
jgi:L-ectoine synthase